MTRPMELAYVAVEVADRDAFATFLTDIVGLAPGGPTDDGAATWTNDGAVHRIIVAEGPADDVTAIGFEVADDDALGAVVSRLEGIGATVVGADEATCRSRRVSRLVSAQAPWGVPVEIIVGLDRLDAAPALPLVPGGFLTDGQGFGHAVIGTTAFDESVRFVTKGLGLVQSDWLEMELMAGIELEVRFFHCNARHHTFALARAPFELPRRLHHVMVETNERDDTGRAFDRAFAAGLPLPNGLGLHPNDQMFSFYVESPAGFQVEVGHGARHITQPWTDDRRYDRISAWGHQPVVRG